MIGIPDSFEFFQHEVVSASDGSVHSYRKGIQERFILTEHYGHFRIAGADAFELVEIGIGIFDALHPAVLFNLAQVVGIDDHAGIPGDAVSQGDRL